MRKRLSMLAVVSFSFLAVASLLNGAGPGSTAPPADLRHNTPAFYALTNARIIVSPSQTIENGTLVFKDGVIASVAAGVAPPADARVFDMTGKTIYAGLIEAYSEPASAVGGGRGFGGGTVAAQAQSQTPSTPTASGGPTNWNSHVTPEFAVDRTYRPDSELNKKLRSQGVVARLAAPNRGIIKGTSCVVDTSDDSANDALIRTGVAQHVALTPSRNRFFGGGSADEDRYPSSPMGAFTLVRQIMYDAAWYKAAWAAHAANRAVPAPEQDAALAALAEQLDSRTPFMIDAQDELYDLRAGRIAEEFKVPVIIRGSGQEYKRVAEIAAMKLPIVVPVNYTRPPNVASPEYAANASLADLMDWDLAPDNPAKLNEAGVTIALSGHGLRDRGEFLKNVRRAVVRGLPKNAALAAMTSTPAKLLGVEKTLGTIEPGKLASFVITDGDLFEEKTRVLETWVDGRRYEVAPRAVVDPRGKWSIASDALKKPIELRVEGDASRLTTSLAPGAGQENASSQRADEPAPRATSRPSGIDGANVTQQDARLSFTFKFDTLGEHGYAEFSAIFEPDQARGAIVTPDGRSHLATLKRTGPPGTSPSNERRGRRFGRGGDNPDDSTTAPTSQPIKASYAVNYPLGDFGRDAIPDQPQSVIFKNATIWTSTSSGTLENADVRIEAGKIAQVGKNLATPPNAIVVDCAGKHLSPGVIDCHSHMATDGGVNEGGQNISAEVRIGDFIDPDDINIYRQLAAGITTANILHGSANAIGGQNQVIKLRWGAGPEAMKFENAPPGIKFALGENPRGANGDRAFNDPRPPRYPQTRMGVAELIRNAFAAARDYRAAQKLATDDPKNHAPVRKDLELEALAEVLEHKRWIHCHSYRQDEILQLIRTCDDFGVKIGSLQHILEGYKVADAIARHGATASTFSDWWAYKLEVYDAIPYNGALMSSLGIIVSFNSDDAEMARRLNSEAAKAMKYGNVSANDAIQYVTLNPARQLRIEDRVGSIEVGKDADLAIWNAPPMSMFAVCQQTWIDGRKYFDRDEDAKARQRDSQMRQALIQKILASGESMTGDDEQPRERVLWPRYDEADDHGKDE